MIRFQRLNELTLLSSFPRKRESRGGTAQGLPACSSQGQILDSRFRGGDDDPS
jgi:hypothetical protein